MLTLVCILFIGSLFFLIRSQTFWNVLIDYQISKWEENTLKRPRLLSDGYYVFVDDKPYSKEWFVAKLKGNNCNEISGKIYMSDYRGNYQENSKIYEGKLVCNPTNVDLEHYLREEKFKGAGYFGVEFNGLSLKPETTVERSLIIKDRTNDRN